MNHYESLLYRVCTSTGRICTSYTTGDDGMCRPNVPFPHRRSYRRRPNPALVLLRWLYVAVYFVTDAYLLLLCSI